MIKILLFIAFIFVLTSLGYFAIKDMDEDGIAWIKTTSAISALVIAIVVFIVTLF